MTAKRITEDECRQLYKEYNTPPHVIRHCEAVSMVAVKIGEALNKSGLNLDIDLVKGAGLAHDIARAGDEHWIVGANILEDLGYKDEADIVRVHMFYNFNSFDKLNETDLVCLGDRLVREDEYVGLDVRIEHIINKAGNEPKRTERILESKKATRGFMDQIEEQIGQTIDSLFVK